MKHLLIIISLLLTSVSWSEDSNYICRPIAKSNMDKDSAYSDHINERDNFISKSVKPKLFQVEKDKGKFGDYELKLLYDDIDYKVYRYLSDIYYLYKPEWENASKQVLMHYYHNANNDFETYRQSSTMYFCEKT